MGEWTVDTDSGYCWWVCWGLLGMSAELENLRLY